MLMLTATLLTLSGLALIASAIAIERRRQEVRPAHRVIVIVGALVVAALAGYLWAAAL